MSSSAQNDPFAGMPPVSFANVDVNALTNAIVQAFQDSWLAQTGEILVLGKADRRYHFLLSLTSWFVSCFETLDLACKQNTLPFALGGFCDLLGTFYGPRGARLIGQGALTQMQFTLSGPIGTISDIPAGTLIQSTDSSAYVFATTQDCQIQPGFLVGYAPAQCVSTDPVTNAVIGSAGNGIAAGVITSLINWPGNFVISATNLNATSSGSDTETDSAYMARLYGTLGSYGGADDSFSNQVGSYGAYKFVAESADASIVQVSVAGPEDGYNPGQVVLTVLAQNGGMPSQTLLNEVYAVLTPDNVRPLTDFVTVQAPSGMPFSVSVSYWVPTAQVNNLATVQANVTTAVDSFILNATTALDVTIDPSILTAAIVDAGGVQVTITQPAYHNYTKQQVPILVDDPVINYLGLS
jgi:phage-related baseplate assembly protein